jgi:hypothetical protein
MFSVHSRRSSFNDSGVSSFVSPLHVKRLPTAFVLASFMSEQVVVAVFAAAENGGEK